MNLSYLKICVDYCFSLLGQAKPVFFLLGLSKKDIRDVVKWALRIGPDWPDPVIGDQEKIQSKCGLGNFFCKLIFYIPQHNNLKTVTDTGYESKLSMSMQKISVNI